MTLTCPFTILADQREKAPYSFDGIRADARRKHRLLDIQPAMAHLPTGDYTIDGMQDLVAIERKSLEDLYATLGQHRDRFEEEHRRLAELSFAAVVIESDLATAMLHRPAWSRLHPKCVYRTWLAWSIRYGVHWWWVGTRRTAEITTYRALEKFWQQQSAQRESHL